MRNEGSPPDPRAFTLRRELRDVIDEILNRGAWSPSDFDRAIETLAGNRALAIRQLLACYREERIADEAAALEVLGRLADDETVELLAGAANDAGEAESARAACALVLLGRERADLLAAADLSRVVLRWQARHVAAEPGLRGPLTRLYASATRDERARWIELQDRELVDADARAATFEMILEGERDAGLRGRVLELLAAGAGPETRAALRRVAPRSPAERAVVETALAAARAPAAVPEGWTARVGCCDGTGCFPLRLDHDRPGRRRACVLFLLDLRAGVREALALSGREVERYDRQDRVGGDDDPDRGLVPIPVADALGLLAEAERSTREAGGPLPADHDGARRLLDPLADVRPAGRRQLPGRIVPGAEERSAELLGHPGYAGWFHDSGERALDAARLATLDRCAPGEAPDREIVELAARDLTAAGVPARLAAMLQHNAVVHAAAGDDERAEIAITTAAVATTERFAELPLVRSMILLSLHPGHHFFTPLPEAPDRRDLACLVHGDEAVNRADVFAIDLAWILTRAGEVWLSRLPCWQRPHADIMERVVFAAAAQGADALVEAAETGGVDAVTTLLDDAGRGLAARFARIVAASDLPPTPADPRRGLLVRLLIGASRTLVLELCLGGCPERCLLRPGTDGASALDRFDFPAGEAARARIVNWPGLLFETPDGARREALGRYLRAEGFDLARCGATTGRAMAVFTCSLCRDRRPTTALSRSVVHGDPAQPVCRRCQRRYRHDEGFRAAIDEQVGPLATR